MYLYIMGRGRSGSTIFDILLGNSSQIESVGELAFGLSHADQDPCSCGAALADCPFWHQVRERLEAEGIAWSEARGLLDRGAGGLWRAWRASRTDPGMLRKAQVTEALARTITTIADKPHLLDSGKSPAHGLLVLRHLPDARVIHLVRDPRTMLESYLWRVGRQSDLNPRQLSIARRNAALFLVKTAIDWTLVNLFCDLMARAYRDRVVRVRFEDLCTRPGAELDRVGRAFGLDLADLAGLARKAASREPLEVGHNIGGNRLRRADAIRFDPGGGRHGLSLPHWLTAATLLLCGPLMWRYGYRLRDGASGPQASPERQSG